jgi:hypothetical protein
MYRSAFRPPLARLLTCHSERRPHPSAESRGLAKESGGQGLADASARISVPRKPLDGAQGERTSCLTTKPFDRLPPKAGRQGERRWRLALPVILSDGHILRAVRCSSREGIWRGGLGRRSCVTSATKPFDKLRANGRHASQRSPSTGSLQRRAGRANGGGASLPVILSDGHILRAVRCSSREGIWRGGLGRRSCVTSV